MSNSKNVGELFEDAQDQGLLSPNSVQVLNVHDIGAQIQQGLGVDVDDVQASEVVLVTMMIDDSGSIKYSDNVGNIINGHNMVLNALKDSKQNDGILIHTKYLNGKVLYPYCSLDQATIMDQSNYDPVLGTPLYDQSVILLGTVLAKTKEFSDNGVPVRTVTMILTDGSDQHSNRHRAKDVKVIVNDMILSESHIISALGVDDGYTDLRGVFSEMGLRDEWILTPKNSESEIRRAFQMFSQSAVRVSQGAINFNKTAIGGFGG
jgi:hypothetical protein